ncbi:DUF4329 domain-containing protein [Lysinibacillus xylanilyticus]|uniref:DUF4329 domain-containing protein n=1 Tax=Lysinibacillus xylanilyticus TaxID=582475 RepID=UPI00381AA319
MENINPRSMKQNTEYGGFVYQKDGLYYSTKPKKGTKASFRPSTALNRVPEGATIVGGYHTHGAEMFGYDNNKFSPADIDFHNSATQQINRDFTSYLGTPSEGFKKYKDGKTTCLG